MTRIVRRTSETPVSAETIERLKRLAELPDSEINTRDIPPMSFKGARRKPNPIAPSSLKKAS